MKFLGYLFNSQRLTIVYAYAYCFTRKTLLLGAVVLVQNVCWTTLMNSQLMRFVQI